MAASGTRVGRPRDDQRLRLQRDHPRELHAQEHHERERTAGWCSSLDYDARRAVARPVAQLDRDLRQHLGHRGGGDARPGGQRAERRRAHRGHLRRRRRDLHGQGERRHLRHRHAVTGSAPVITGAGRRAADAGRGAGAAGDLRLLRGLARRLQRAADAGELSPAESP